MPVFWVDQTIDGWCVFRRDAGEALADLVGCYSSRALAEFVQTELAKRAEREVLGAMHAVLLTRGNL